MKKVLILANHSIVIKFRIELIQRLVQERHEVYISAPYDKMIDEIIEEKCVYREVKMERRKTNPFKDYRLIIQYKDIIKEINPDIIFSYTIKPNIYGGIVAAKMNIPFVPNVTGLGTAVENNNLLSKLVLLLYRVSFRKAQTVFFQNTENMSFFKNKNIAVGRHKLLPGSGVNLQHFSQQEYPQGNIIKFVFISRIMREKGIVEYLEVAKKMKKRYPQTQFHVCGFCEEAFEETLGVLEREKIIEYHGMVRDIRTVLKDMHCVVLPSYHEGMSNVLLEAAAMGRPLIASNIPGCRETFEADKGGYLVNKRDSNDLFEKMEQFFKLPYEVKREMGISARKYVEEHFDRQKVVDAYMSELQRIAE